MLQILNHAGYWAPVAALVSGIYQTWLIDAVFFIMFAALNVLVVKGLKVLIAEPRPEGAEPLYAFDRYSGAEQYGMPSGHASVTAFVATYVLAYTGCAKSSISTIATAALVPLTMAQRYLTRAHTAMQLLVGAVLGTVMALFSVYAARRITRRDKKEHDS